ncbi:MAG: RIP metalloprotease RseP [Methylobacterium sp.]|nr:RIP metalloprotease RseP [Methylobacterium sp.]MCA3597105.1 RIP metalloprotease RseP [Methylobacterium sp.]MCA3604428.1 RIP metalloprotease RseP [Methylobacterium sp.]MCA3610245.1 RIP metalloprotease RseP [Methylobacterium sp.]MCA3615299.1 RIP metalloprotease RseP [Methylobacterium sp.]
MGHFLVGRYFGVKVETFSLGFGPRLFSRYDKHGTEWAISAIPLGGFVKFKGDANAASLPDHQALDAMPVADRSDSFPHQSVARRAAIVAAGPLANFLLAFVIFMASFSLVGRSQVQPVIAGVADNSPAAAAGFMPGDRVLAINGDEMVSFEDVVRRVSLSEGQELAFRVERDGRELELSATPRIMTRKTVLGTERRPIMGFIASNLPESHFLRRYGPIEAAGTAVGEIYFVIDRTVHYIAGLAAGREKADQLSGPVRIGYVSGKVAESGIGPLLMLAGILSISIGFINLLPIPMLDGGHLVFYAAEALRGRPLSARAQEWSFRMGFALVLALMLFSTWNDIMHLTGLAF